MVPVDYFKRRMDEELGRFTRMAVTMKLDRNAAWGYIEGLRFALQVIGLDNKDIKICE